MPHTPADIGTDFCVAHPADLERELSCKLGNYFGLRKLGSRQQLREVDIGQIPHLVIMVVCF